MASGPVCIWSAHETNVYSAQLQQYIESNKYLLAQIFWMHEEQTLKLQPPWQIF